MNLDQTFFVLGVLVIAAPAALLTVLGGAALLGKSLEERTINRFTQASVVTGLLASIGVLVLMLVYDRRLVTVAMGDWLVLPEQHFHFTFKFIFDRLSVPFV